MRTIHNEKETAKIERERALVGTYVDRNYSPQKIEWLLSAREGFDEHAKDSWHLLIPIKAGYGVDTWVSAHQYNTAVAAEILDRLEVSFADTPCVAFRSSADNYFFLKLGGMDEEAFKMEIGLIAEVARDCQNVGPFDPDEYRVYVNKAVASHLRKRKLLSAAKGALPALGMLLGGAVDLKDLF